MIRLAPVRRPQLLDLFCGAGSAAMGYHRAGFDVTGVDRKPQPRYPFPFILADALEYVREHGHEYDAIHASPPCQDHSSMKYVTGRQYGSLITETRKALLGTSLPFVIENVPLAPLISPVLLCGTQFGLQVIRHRKFECGGFTISDLLAPHSCHNATIDGRVCAFRNGGRVRVGRRWPLRTTSTDFRDSMGCGWMTGRDARQAIPPAYTEFIGRQLMQYLRLPQPVTP